MSLHRTKSECRRAFLNGPWIEMQPTWNRYDISRKNLKDQMRRKRRIDDKKHIEIGLSDYFDDQIEKHIDKASSF